MLKSQPLLKFRGEDAFLAPEGLEAIRGLPGAICPIIFIGDGRGGKSYLASRLLNLEGAFISSDAEDPVTEGIDAVVAPMEAVLQGAGGELSGTAAKPPSGQYALVLDCEGGNNAMAAIRTLVNVFGIILGTEVVFVANGMATEQALQNLGASLAARSLIRLDGSSRLPEQRLIFVVNKNTLKYEDATLEKILATKYDDAGRQDLRDTILAAFPERDFCTVPLMGMPDFEESVEALRTKIIEGRRPLTVSGAALQGSQLCGLLEFVVAEIRKAHEVNFPSMKRFVILDGFLLPLVGHLAAAAQGRLPKLEDYCPDLAASDPREAALAEFDKAAAHLAHEAALLQEAREALQARLASSWREVEEANEAFGLQVLEIQQEEREVITASSTGPLGGEGLLRNVVITKQEMRVECRAVVHKKRGGDPECSGWTATRRTLTRLKESAFGEVPELPVLQSCLLKRSPSLARAALKFLNKHMQERVCILKDGHFLWWEPEVLKQGGAARGCINFLVHSAEVAADPLCATGFSIAPAAEQGWSSANVSFTGGGKRVFCFDVGAGEVPRDEWVQAIRQHIEFAELARRQVGQEALLRQAPAHRPAASGVGGV